MSKRPPPLRKLDDNESRHYRCLLYTSDAADERSSVDLGGRRIIKKKKKKDVEVVQREHKKTGQDE